MSKYCPVTDDKVVYLSCLECDEKCRGDFVSQDSTKRHELNSDDGIGSRLNEKIKEGGDER